MTLPPPFTRNVNVSGHRTSLRMEPAMWEALEEISGREARTIHDICTLVNQHRGPVNLTAALRVFIVSYFRQAATEAGHMEAGHGETGPEMVLSAISLPEQPAGQMESVC